MEKKLFAFSIFSVALFAITFGGAFSSAVMQGGSVLIHGLSAQVGVSVGVSENEFTHLAQQITEKQEELIEREKNLEEREKAIERKEEIVNIFSIEWYVTILAFILLVLVLLNFYLDWRRENYYEDTV